MAQSISSVWSIPTLGLSGRLLIEFEDLNPGLRYAVYLELRNHSLDPVAVSNQPQIHAQLCDVNGSPISTSRFSISGPIAVPQWAVIPKHGYIGFRIDMQTVGVPTREHGMALIAVGGQTWQLKAGEYLLKAIATFKRDETGPKSQWVGELELPPCVVLVTQQTLTMD